MKITQSRNQREGKFIGFAARGWKEDKRGHAVRYTFHYRGEFGRVFRQIDLRNRNWSEK